jgi:hypothetical protein
MAVSEVVDHLAFTPVRAGKPLTNGESYVTRAALLRFHNFQPPCQVRGR